MIDLEVTAFAPSSPATASQLGRRAVITSLENFDSRHGELVLNGSGAVLVFIDSDERQGSVAWRTFERQLLEQPALGGLYVVSHVDTETQAMSELSDIYEHLLNGDALATQLNPFRNAFHVSAAFNPAPALVKEPLSWNVHALMSPSNANAGAHPVLKSSKPIFAIVTHFDVFSAVPHLSTGVDGNGSGVAMLLELARLFHLLFASTSRQTVTHELLFVVTSGDRLRFDGTSAWLESLPPSLSDRLSYALCLDSLASSTTPELRLHISRSAKTDFVARLYQSFEQVASDMGLDFQLVQKKINLANPTVYWQHEQFSRKRLTAGTLSHLAEAQDPLDRAALQDRRYSPELLLRNTRFVAEVVVKSVLNIHDQLPSAIFDQELAPSAEHLRSVMARLAATSRFTLGSTDALVDNTQPSDLFRSIVQRLEAFTGTTATLASVKGPADIQFYTPTTLQLRLYTIKPFSFELVITLLTFVYLLGLYIVLHPRGTAFAIKSLTSLLEAQKPRPHKQ